MPLQKFDPPGFANDLSDALKSGWSEKMNSWIENERTHLDDPYDKFFFNELQHPEAENGAVVPITWEGFPRYWKLKFPSDLDKRYQASEGIYKVRGIECRYQDEYLEWHSYKLNNKLQRIVFTCEGPEYWEYIANTDEQKLLELYKSYVDSSVQLNDLFISDQGERKYNPSNKWNVHKGIVHLTHPANTLGAEINLAAQATILRKKGNTDPVSDTHDLICCSGFGVESRFSDPTIGGGVNSFVRQGLSVTLNNPVGLYIHKLDTSPLEVPDGFQVKDFWKVIRGDDSKKMILRAEFSVPEGSDISLEDVKIGGNNIKYGAQVAELVEMVIFGKAFKFEGSLPKSIECGNFCDTSQSSSFTKHIDFLNKRMISNPSVKLGLRAQASKIEYL